MEYKFSSRVQNLKPSAIREIFKYSADPTYIPLSAGNPAPDAFPAEELAKISQEVLTKLPISVLQYSTTEGYAPLRDYLKSFLKEKYDMGTDNDTVLITSGAQQIMNLLTKSMVDKGDVILCEAPSFIGSLNTFRSYEAKLVGIPMDNDGVNLEALQEALKTNANVKYFYTIPNFQNPSGITMSFEKRKAVYELCRKYGVLILEDNPYGDLRIKGEDIPSIKTLDTDGIVVYAGSFSKVIAPGIRVGYVLAPQEIISKMVVCKQGEDVHTNIWAQTICYRFLTEYNYGDHINRLRDIYRKKADVLLSAMEKYFTPKGITWAPFDGGIFAWCTLPEDIDMKNYVAKVLEKKVCVIPGSAFLTDETEPCSSFRINFSTPTDEQLVKGVELLGSIL